MESGGENHSARGKSGGGNGGGLSWDIWEVGGPWGGAALHHAHSHHAVQSVLLQTSPQVTALNAMPPSPSFFTSSHDGYQRTAANGSGDAHHLTCLKLGKRQYYEESQAHVSAAVSGSTKRERVSSASIGLPLPAAASATSSLSPSAAAPAVVPRCQVEGCNVALVDAKEYHRRHKVCEIHSKAPKVVVLGTEQRFCQQCSRFHVVSEFDDSKRSCRRRLAGHNERRRKSSAESIIRNSSHLDNTTLAGFPCISALNSPPTRALSLLSPKASHAWVSSDISSQSSAALRELIAENRAAVLARQLLISDHGRHSMNEGGALPAVFSYVPPLPVDATLPLQHTDGWEHLRGASPHVTLDLMQVPSSSFEFLSARNRSKDEEEECCDIWKSLEGTHVV